MNYSWMIISLLRWIEYDRTSKHGYSEIPFLNAHLKTGWLSLIDNVFGQCTKLLFCWKIFSVKDKRDSITWLPLSPYNCPLGRNYTCTSWRNWAFSIGNVINRTQYPFEELNCHFHIKMIYTSFHTPHPTNMIHLYLIPPPQDLPDGIQRPLYPILNGAKHILSRLVQQTS